MHFANPAASAGLACFFASTFHRFTAGLRWRHCQVAAQINFTKFLAAKAKLPEVVLYNDRIWMVQFKCWGPHVLCVEKWKACLILSADWWAPLLPLPPQAAG